MNGRVSTFSLVPQCWEANMGNSLASYQNNMTQIIRGLATDSIHHQKHIDARRFSPTFWVMAWLQKELSKALWLLHSDLRSRAPWIKEGDWPRNAVICYDLQGLTEVKLKLPWVIATLTVMVLVGVLLVRLEEWCSGIMAHSMSARDLWACTNTGRHHVSAPQLSVENDHIAAGWAVEQWILVLQYASCATAKSFGISRNSEGGNELLLLSGWFWCSCLRESLQGHWPSSLNFGSKIWGFQSSYGLSSFPDIFLVKVIINWGIPFGQSHFKQRFNGKTKAVLVWVWNIYRKPL